MLIRKDLPTNQPEYFEWTLAERDIALLFFFCFFYSYQSAITSKKKTLDTEKPEKRNWIGIFAGRWGKETDIGEGGEGRGATCQGKNTLHALQEHKIFTLNRD